MIEIFGVADAKEMSGILSASSVCDEVVSLGEGITNSHLNCLNSSYAPIKEL